MYQKRTLLLVTLALFLGGVVYALVAPLTPKKSKTAQEKPKKVSPAARTLLVTNKIDKKMTGYRKMGKTWHPDDYALSINGTEIKCDEQANITACADGTCNLVFSYDFRPMGYSYKKGTEELNYAIPEDAHELEISFSWYEKPNIMVTAYEKSSKVAPATGV